MVPVRQKLEDPSGCDLDTTAAGCGMVIRRLGLFWCVRIVVKLCVMRAIDTNGMDMTAVVVCMNGSPSVATTTCFCGTCSQPLLYSSIISSGWFKVHGGNVLVVLCTLCDVGCRNRDRDKIYARIGMD